MRKIKVLGLMLVAIFAMSAVAASAASANEFTATEYPVTLTGSTHPGFTDEFVTTTGAVKCEEAKYTGTASGPTTAITVTPSYNKCTAFGFPAVIDTNECTYTFRIGAAEGTTSGTVDLNCPAGKEVTVTAISAGTNKCTVHVAPQANLGSITYTNIGSGTTEELTVDVNLINISYKHTKGTGLGACPEGSAATGSLTAKALVTGEKDPLTGSGDQHIGIKLSVI